MVFSLQYTDENLVDKLPFIHFMNFASRPSSLFQTGWKASKEALPQFNHF